MSDSLILMLSQGIEKYTIIWTWLCVVTDFFGIFLTLTWVFYNNDMIDGDFLGYFNIFGTIWIWKFGIATLLPVALLLIGFLCSCYCICVDEICELMAAAGITTIKEYCLAVTVWILFCM